ncbi:MAG: flavoprotein, partial [Methylococcaceae bacterium]|nr:flavoprotein [Methylococcaceae bacterium]
MSGKKRLIIAMTGATGAIYGVRLLEVLRQLGNYETHLIVSSAGFINLRHELDMDRRSIHALADVAHDVNDVAASIASGAFKTCGMIVAP